METRWFEDILALIEEGNLSSAAERRAITQPAFSRRIRAFEAWLGQDVIDRTTNKVIIRESLKRSETDIRAFLHRLREVQQSIRQADNDIPRITIATQHALTLSTFPEFLKAIEAADTQFNYRLRTANREECISMIIRGDADALLCYETKDQESLPFDERFCHNILSVDRMIPVAGGSLRYELSDDQSIPPGAPVILYPENSYFGQVLQHLCPEWQNTQQSLRPICETAFSAGVREMVLQGIGIAWLPISLIKQDVSAGQLIDLSASLGSCELSICLYSKSNHPLTEAVQNYLMN